MIERKTILYILFVAGAALVLRLLLFAAISVRNPAGFLDTDSHSYLQVADEFSRLGAYASGGSPEHSRTPGYPVFLAAFMLLGAGAPAMVAAQIFFSALTCILTVLFAYRLTGNLPASFIPGFIVALDIPSIATANLLMTETLFTFFLLLSIFLLLDSSRSKILAAGAFMGVSILFRPIAAYLPFIAAFFIVLFKSPLKKKNLIPAAVYLAGCLIVVSPWLVRNKIVFNSGFLSTISGKSMLYYRAAGVHSVKHGIPFPESQAILRESVDRHFYGRPPDPVARAVYERRLASDILFENPGIYARNHLASSLVLLLSPMRSSLDIQLGLSPAGTTLELWRLENAASIFQRLKASTSAFTFYIVIIQLVMTLVAGIWAVAGIIALLRGRAPPAGFIPLAAAAYFILLSGGPEAYARFRVPLVPFIAILSGVGAARLHGWGRGEPGISNPE